MKKLGPREAQLRALREAQFEERQRQARKPATVSTPETPHRETETARSLINETPLINAPLLTANARWQSTWRKTHPDLNRKRAREGMQKLRARRKAAA